MKKKILEKETRTFSKRVSEKKDRQIVLLESNSELKYYEGNIELHLSVEFKQAYECLKRQELFKMDSKISKNATEIHKSIQTISNNGSLSLVI